METHSPERQQHREARLAAILTKAIPALPNHVFELNTLLSSTSVDLKRVGKIIREDSALSTQILRLCNSALFNLRRRVLTIEEIAILMGSERLRTFVLTCSIMEFASLQLPAREVRMFWQHSFMSAMLSERIARWIEYPECEQAYLGGLLHDVGALLLLAVAHEENKLEGETVRPAWRESLVAETDFFGMNHCEAGRTIGRSWNFPASFIDVFENHHHPDRSACDHRLVGIVAAADHFCEWHSLDPIVERDTLEGRETDPSLEDDFFSLCFPRLAPKDRSELSEMLETEYLHLLPVIEFSCPARDSLVGGKG